MNGLGAQRPPASWYQFSPDRKGQHPNDHLAKYQGKMHVDGYAGFEGIYRLGDIRKGACMAHKHLRCLFGGPVANVRSGLESGQLIQRRDRLPGVRNSFFTGSLVSHTSHTTRRTCVR